MTNAYGKFYCPACRAEKNGYAPTGSYSYLCSNCGRRSTYTLLAPPGLQYFTCPVCGTEALDSNFYEFYTPAVAWQQSHGPVHIAGMRASLFASGGFGGIGTERCLIYPQYAVQHPGRITHVKLNFDDAPSASGSKFKVFRWNAGTSLFDLVSDQALTLSEAAGIQTVTLASPVTVQVGDVVGIWQASPGCLHTNLATGKSIRLRYDYTDIVTSNAFNIFGIDGCSEMEALGDAPYLALVGDSRIAGHNNNDAFFGPLEDAPVGAITGPGPRAGIAAEPGYEITQIFGDFLSCRNSGIGSITFAGVLSSGIVDALAANPHTVIVAAGINDVALDRTWDDVEDDLDAIRALCTAADLEQLLICEIIPASTVSDAQAAVVRTWNSNLAVWCAANDATLIPCHDAFGQIRPATGQLDDLKTAYDDGSGVHLSLAGVAAWAEIMKEYL